MKKYYKEYKLLIDLPTGEKKGDHFIFCTNYDTPVKFWYEKGEKAEASNYWIESKKRDQLRLNIEQMSKNFFKPIGKEYSLYPEFPSKNEVLKHYYLIGEPKFVNSVPFIRASKDIFYSEEFEQKVYEIFKNMYNDKHGLSGLMA